MSVKTRDGNRTATHQLVALAINESSPVTAGDNPDAHILLLKKQKEEAEARRKAEQAAGQRPVRKGLWQTLKEKLGVTSKDYSMQPRTVGQIMVQDRVSDELWKLRMALMESVYSIMDCAPMEEWAKLFAKNSEEMNAEMDRIIGSLGATGKAQDFKALMVAFNAAAKGWEGGQTAKGGELADLLKQIEDFTFGNGGEAAQPGAHNPQTQEEEEDMSTKNGKPGAAALSKALEGITDVKVRESVTKAHEAAVAEALKDAQPAAPAAPAAPAPAPAPAAPEMTPAEKAMMAKMDAVLADNQKLRDEVGLLTKKDQVNKFVQKARKLVEDGLGLPVKKVAAQLQGAYERSEEAGKELEEMFKASAAQSGFSGSIDEQLGYMGVDDDEAQPAENSAHAKLMELAEKMREKDPELSIQQAYAKAGRANPALKKQAIRAQQ